MNTTLTRFSKQYRAALRKNLLLGSQSTLPPITELGRRAVALGLETLDLARIHTQALTSLGSQHGASAFSEGMIKRASAFFAEAVTSIEKTHRPALKAGVQAKHLHQSLRQRTVEASAAAQQLKRGVVECQAAEEAFKKSEQHRNKLLQDSQRLQKRLRHLTHEILAVQEAERQKMSHQLHDEISQTLLGINVRLLALKNAAKANTGSFKREIASTQRVVKQSVKTIDRLAHEIGLHHES